MAVTRFGVINIGAHELDMEIYDISAASRHPEGGSDPASGASGQRRVFGRRASAFQVLDEMCRVAAGLHGDPERDIG